MSEANRNGCSCRSTRAINSSRFTAVTGPEGKSAFGVRTHFLCSPVRSDNPYRRRCRATATAAGVIGNRTKPSAERPPPHLSFVSVPVDSHWFRMDPLGILERDDGSCKVNSARARTTAPAPFPDHSGSNSALLPDNQFLDVTDQLNCGRRADRAGRPRPRAAASMAQAPFLCDNDQQ